MYDVVHAMRTRIITSPSFSGDKVLGAILFEDTMVGPPFCVQIVTSHTLARMSNGFLNNSARATIVSVAFQSLTPPGSSSFRPKTLALCRIATSPAFQRVSTSGKERMLFRF